MKKIVFVLGAGASVDFHLPIGAQLTGEISQALNFKFDGRTVSGGDPLLIEAFTRSYEECQNWDSASRLIASAMPLAPSIDNFVDAHRDDLSIAFCAKAAIARCILNAERNSTIYVSPSNIYNTIGFKNNVNAWHTLFFRILSTNCTLNDLPARLQSLGVISFNYDRCFEHFLFHAIKTYYKTSNEKAAEILTNLEIYHPYGKVGGLPYLDSGDTVEYGAEVSWLTLLKISKQIRTFTESVDEESSDIQCIRRMAFENQNLVFLGFAFHSLNMQLLFPNFASGYSSYGKNIIATALGSSESDLRIIENDLRARYQCERGNADLRKDLTCSGLFTEYSRTLSLT